MSDKQRFSFSRAIDSLIRRNCLLDNEAIFDNEIRRRIESTEALSLVRGGSILPNTHSFFVPNFVFRRDVTAGGSGAGIVSRESIGLYSDLLDWSTAVRQGAITITNAVGSAHLGMTTSLPGASWIAETGQTAEADPIFAGAFLEPKRISARVICSSMLLSLSPDAENLLITDLGKSLSRGLDQAVYYGTGVGDQPMGILAHPNTNKVVYDPAWWQQLTELESLCASADVSENFFGYVVSPVTRRELKRTVCGSGSTDLIWPQLTRPLASNVISANQAFAGCYDNLVIIIWAIEIVINPYRFADRGQVELVANFVRQFLFPHPESLWRNFLKKCRNQKRSSFYVTKKLAIGTVTSSAEKRIIKNGRLARSEAKAKSCRPR
jgi:hypothetical protein